MIRSKLCHLSLSGGVVSGHTIPMRTFADLLLKWDAALREVLPRLAAEAGIPPDALEHIEPVISPPDRGSVVAAYGYALPPSATHASAPFLFTNTDALDEMVGTFETGVVGLQERHTVPRWMTVTSARAIARLLKDATQQGIHVTLPDAGNAELTRDALAVLTDFVTAEEGQQGECELQIIGNIIRADVARGRMVIDAARRGRVRVTFPKGKRRAVCTAMAEGNAVELVVKARLSSDGTLHHAKLRGFRDLGSRPDYRAAFEQLWATGQDVFHGVPRDERGIPDPDSVEQ